MKKGQSKETALAAEAFHLYLQLPNPRDWRKLAGTRLKRRNGKLGTPLMLNTLKMWSYVHNWSERARQFDEEVYAREREELIAWRVEQAKKRERERGDDATVLRTMARGYLTFQEDDVLIQDEEEVPIPPEIVGTPRPMALLDPQFLSLSKEYIKQAADIEHKDMGSIMKQFEQPDPNAQKSGTVVVLTPDGLDQLRNMVQEIKQVPAPQPALADQDIVEGEYEVS